MQLGPLNRIFAASLLFGGVTLPRVLCAGNQQPVAHLAAAVNVNSRYIVEAVEVTGYNQTRIGDALAAKLQALVGTSYDTETVDELARQMRNDFHAKAVTQRLARGSSPENVRIVFDVTRRSAAVDISVPKFLYHSKQGWSAQVEATATIARNNNVTFGVVSDGDELTERYAGIRAGYENLHVGSDRVHFRFLFEDYHEQWNGSTVNALSNPGLLNPNFLTTAPDIYRARMNYEPLVSFNIAKPLVVTAGVSFERLQENLPSIRTEGAHAMVFGLQYHKRNGESDEDARVIDASYDARIATKALGSDYIYTRHRWIASWTWLHGRHSVNDTITAGLITGRAPMFERFVVGTSSLLRGWNSYDIDPLGGNRLVHNSVDYRYRFADVFYDAGSLWSHGKRPALRHSVGIGAKVSIVSLAVAFPVRTGRVDPVFMVGMNY
jgi:outer membrane protein assembly factor BamA